MKRFLIRLSLISGVAVIGLIAIAQAQRGDAVAEAATGDATVKPTADAGSAPQAVDLLSQAQGVLDNPPSPGSQAKSNSRLPVTQVSTGASGTKADSTAQAADPSASSAATSAAGLFDAARTGQMSSSSAAASPLESSASATDSAPSNRYGNGRYGNDRYGDNRYGDATISPPAFTTQRQSQPTSAEAVAGDAPAAASDVEPTPAGDAGATSRLLPPSTATGEMNRSALARPATADVRREPALENPAFGDGRTAPTATSGQTEPTPADPLSGTNGGSLRGGPDRGFSDRSMDAPAPGGAASRFSEPSSAGGDLRATVGDSRMSEPATLQAGPANPLRGAGEPAPSVAMPLGADRGGSIPRGEEGLGRPGLEHLEGAQAPSLTIEKFAPAEIQIGKSAVFEILVRNVGKVPAQNVTIHDQIPKKTQLVGTTPPAARSPEGDLVWKLGTMEPGGEHTVQLEVMPIDEGEVGSVATVQFSAHSSVKTIATRPELQLEVVAPKEAMIGSDVALVIKISNPGSGPATGVVLKEFVPENFSHSGGTELEYEVGELKPKETRELELVIKAAKAGVATNLLTARGDGSLQARSQSELEVIAPALAVAMDGPKKRYLEREATYTVSISNPGTAAAREVELVTYLPKGLEFVKADNFGEWDPQSRAVRWSLEELPANETGSVMLTAMPIEAGEQKVVIEGTADQGLSARDEQSVLVEGVAAILFQVVDIQDPIEVNGETAYEIRVVNQGSKAATGVQLQAILPPQMKVLSANGPTEAVLERDGVLFGKLGQLAPRADATYIIRVQGLAPGDLRMRVQVVTNEITTPVSKEESTRVYSDE
jgi:uncharacterized repeat protein (TIGR01451 family)